MLKYITLEKQVGETPLSCIEAWRAEHPTYADTPLAYAGRLDPMASGKLLVLIGDECKQQSAYHDLDKEYEFSILFGIESDSLDVLGRLSVAPPPATLTPLSTVTQSLVGEIELPYPRFSAKTVNGKPLHTWTLEGRLDEIEIPLRRSTIYSLQLDGIECMPRSTVCHHALEKIETIPPVTDERKALGADFRRVDVRRDWQDIATDPHLPADYQIAHFRCIASSGTYMRSLAALMAKRIGTSGLAWRIHRTHIGRFDAAAHEWTLRY